MILTQIMELWEHRFKLSMIIIVALLALCKRQHEAVTSMRHELSIKPMVNEQIITRTVQGPVRIVEKIVEKQGERIVERIYVQEEVTSENSDAKEERTACPYVDPPKRWIVGSSVDPFNRRLSPMVRGGVTLGGEFDITLGHSVLGPGRTEVGFGLRF